MARMDGRTDGRGVVRTDGAAAAAADKTLEMKLTSTYCAGVSQRRCMVPHLAFTAHTQTKSYATQRGREARRPNGVETDASCDVDF